MERLSLNGKWSLRRSGGAKLLPATVPGCVHTDLVAAGEMENPFHRSNELKVQWVEEHEWIYTRTFSVSRRLLQHDRVLLVCHGLDTLATLQLNERTLGTTDNMFRAFEFDVKSVLKPGRNELSVRFASVLPAIREQQARRFLYAGRVQEFEPVSHGYVRKMGCNFGWDWAPRLITCGIWQPIEIVAFSDGRLSDVWIRQEHRGAEVKLTIGVAAQAASEEPLSARVSLSLAGRGLGRGVVRNVVPEGSVSLRVRSPRLWWPAGLGEQPLYDVTVELVDGWGRVLDTSRKRVGLRRLRLARRADRFGESFQFEVNGTPFFAKGANWVPAHAFPSAVSAETYRELLHAAAGANMNMLRVWGGGFYESDLFYDLCDELGICVWQDFMAACSHVPLFDQRFVDNFCAEATQQVRRLRHHACIALWCGNNEFEQDGVGENDDPRRMHRDEYEALFDRRLADIASSLSPQTDYWPGSPHSPNGPRKDYNNPTCGDAHLWYVWGSDRPIGHYLTATHRFVSEFGFQSLPHWRTVESFTNKADRRLDSAVMQQHQRSYGGNEKILRHAVQWFRPPKDFASTVWQSQALQALAIQTGVEHFRRSRPRCMGALYWMLDDCWPVVSWSSIDFYGRWKALHYAARRFYAPVLVSGRFDPQRSAVDVFVCNDTHAAVRGRVGWIVTDAAGKRLSTGTTGVSVSPNTSARVKRVRLARLIAGNAGQPLMVWLELMAGGRTQSRNLVLTAEPRRYELCDPEISVTVRQAGQGSFRVSLAARKPALWAWLDCEGVDLRCSDNAIHLRPGAAASIDVTPSRLLTLEQLRARIKVRSLVDTYA